VPKKPDLTTMIADAWDFQQAYPNGYSKSASSASA
jgi:hypothetical protein